MKHQRGDFAPNKRIIFLSVAGALIGAIAAFVAKGLLALIALFTNIFYFAKFSIDPAAPSMEHWGAAFIFVPVVGGLVIGLMAYYGSEKIRGHGIPEALEAILFGKSIMQPKVAILKPISSAISIGSGGPFGAEGPIIMTGGAVGSLIAQCFHVTSAERKTLLVAGAAAGMSAIFSTPLAAVLLAVELLLFELKPRSLVPVAIACAFAAVVRIHLLGSGPIFPVAAHPALDDFALLGAVLVGLSAGFFSSLLSKVLYKLEDLFQMLPIHWMWWPALGGLGVGLGGYLSPRALGVGYDVIGDLLNGHLATQALLLLLAVKVVIWLIALASGTSGGVLAPLLIFGCALGTLEAQWLPGSTSAGTWALISMGAVMGGMMRSPFTAILFCFELTKDTEVLLPLLIASLCSYAFTVLFMRRSILTEKIARRGFDIFREYGVDPLERLNVQEAMTSNPQFLLGSTSLEQVIHEVSKNIHSAFPILSDDKKTLLGIITTSDLEKIAQLDDTQKLKAQDIIQTSPITIFPEESCRMAADKMAENDIGRILVVSRENPQQLLGLITRSDLLKARRMHFSEESHQEKILFKKTVTGITRPRL
jgi:H+/Cl- antiporter ClcA/CBS domain-containing protein